MLYLYEEMPLRVRAVIGGAVLARAAAFCVGRRSRHDDRRDGLDLGRAGSAGCGSRGGPNEVA
eukprot:3274047-Prymnesium_polylepis.1